MGMGRRRQDYKRITDLFVPGTVILPTEDSPPVWIQKLNAFETEEARAHASARRALVVEALKNPQTDSNAALRNAAAQMTRDQLIDSVVQAAYGRHMAQTANSIAADPAWQERQAVLDRIDPTEVADAEQQQVLTDFNAEYFQRIRDGVNSRDEELKDELGTCDEESLRERYVDGYIEARGFAVFSREQRVAEIVMGARMCDAQINDSGTYDYEGAHAPCSHERLFVDEPVTDEEGGPALQLNGKQRMLTAYEQVRALPDELFNVYTAAFDGLNVPRHQAKSSASRQSSSEPSRPQSAQEDSTASTPEAPSTTPDGT